MAQRIINYLKVREKELGVKMYTERDFSEIRMWSAEHIEQLCQSMAEYLQSRTNLEVRFLTVSQLCPWCTYNSSCTRCRYGERHNICGDDNDEWDRLLEYVYSMPPTALVSREVVEQIVSALRGE